MGRVDEARRVTAIRSQLAGLDDSDWRLGSGGDGMQLFCGARDGSLVAIAAFTGQANSDEMQFAADAPSNVRFLLGLLDRAIEALRPKPPAPPPAAKKNHAAEAAMLCGEPAFKRFLMERHGLESPATDDRAAQKLRSLLGVTSRAEINENDAVRERWFALRGDFYAWKGRGIS